MTEQLDRSRFASRFDTDAPPSGAPTGEPLLGSPPAAEVKPPVRPAAAGGGLAPDAAKPEEGSYTNRLLKAKQRVWEEREKEKEKEQDKHKDKDKK